MNLLASHAFLMTSPPFLQVVRAMAARGHNVIIDSGAFTNLADLHAGRPPRVRLEDYCDACESEYAKWAFGYVALDVVGDHAASARNLDRMVARGLKPMPVLTSDADVGSARELVEVNERITVAGSVGGRRKWIRRRLETTAEVCGGKAKIHALGYLKWPEVFTAPIDTCDTSSAVKARRWGNIFLYSRASGFTEYPRGAIWSEVPMRYLARCGLSKTVFEQASKLAHRKRNWIRELATMASYCQLHDHVCEFGKRWFFAVCGVGDLAAVTAVYHHMRPDGSFDYMRAMRDMHEIEHGGAVPYREPFTRQQVIAAARR